MQKIAAIFCPSTVSKSLFLRSQRGGPQAPTAAATAAAAAAAAVAAAVAAAAATAGVDRVTSALMTAFPDVMQYLVLLFHEFSLSATCASASETLALETEMLMYEARRSSCSVIVRSCVLQDRLLQVVFVVHVAASDAGPLA